MRILSTLVPSLCLFAPLAAAGYTLKDDYGTSDSFFDKFNFFTGKDPTNGYVSYVDRSTAQSGGLIKSGSSVYVGVDTVNTASDPGRSSVRLESTNTYDHGLVILDLNHMPGSVCGSWPAFWMLGSNWPNNGEIDIIEGVNDQTSNQFTLHTGDGCSIDSSGFSGTVQTSNCYVEASGQSENAGCAITSSSDSSYGGGFNKNGGGVYATEWTGDAISVWVFSNSSVPSDITSGTPNPLGWGTPSAKFAGSCDIDSHFKELQIVFDITFCGDWAGETWSSGSCASKDKSCKSYVQNNPSAFAESYWGINSLKVYQDSSSSKRDIHSHAAAHIRQGAGEPISYPNVGRNSSNVRFVARPTWKHRRDRYKHGQ
ncbi:hypothetical protein N7532_010850 [Penicillium argentinense]|uniref:endo-1,3(4)-beta-glucanase n=1 Tax=Penicillium argentinense TaxID=1131581 RepID=A0A9W9EQR2_9EURO|nr:uncharacterized protein N7532_010850 [Penicillium argentinense]KAJ5086079.1 hypothetical protein N7532_010850 [Penicillium argentinense]